MWKQSRVSDRRPLQFDAFRELRIGAWDEPQFTGTGFPKVFYLKYHLYRHYFPLMALGRYRRYSDGPES